MPNNEFKVSKTKLAKARTKVRDQRESLSKARDELKRTELQRRHLTRWYKENNDEHREQRNELESLYQGRQSRVNELEDALKQSLDELRPIWNEYTPMTDPREQISELDDSYPILLLPVRLETRFKKIVEENLVNYELWVRIYPDDVAVDSFEPILSDSELASVKQFWIDNWQSGGVDEDDRAAWRALVSSYGSGRAEWIINGFKPQNEADKPSKVDRSDIVLVIATESPLSVDDQTAAEAYWRAVWLADTDSDALEAAAAALETSVSEQVAEKIKVQYQPANLSLTPDINKARDEITLIVVTLVFPKSASIETKLESWTRPSRVDIMPDRFVILGYNDDQVTMSELGLPIPSPLVISPDPSAPEGEQIKQEDGEIVLSEELNWMVNFERAIEVGMGMKISLSKEQFMRGFDRLLAIGVSLGFDEKTSSQRFENLIKNHHYSGTGLSLLRQGTPTNNTEEGVSDYTWNEDANESFELVFGESSSFDEADWFKKKDGQWLAESLGIDSSIFKTISNATGTDQSEARSMNSALWPATLGYFMDTMMEPVFSEETIARTRWYFTNFVSGRGMIPAIRVGEQPYGILPATAYSRMSWFRERPAAEHLIKKKNEDFAFLRRMHKIITKAESDWSKLIDRVAHATKPGDQHQNLLDILGLHSGSVSFYQRYAETLDQLFNRVNLMGLGDQIVNGLAAMHWMVLGIRLLEEYGYPSEEDLPDIIERFFFNDANRLTGPVVDDLPLSETDPIRAYTPDPEKWNYIEWLANAAGNSLHTLREQKGFIDSKVPTALLYIFMRHALILGYHDAGLRLFRSAEILSTADLSVARREKTFIHISSDQQEPESRWHYLYQTEPRITNGEPLLVAEYITQLIQQAHDDTTDLKAQIDALRNLEQTPTAKLERAFAEHIDCVSYRLDAWKLGLVHYQLAAMRYSKSLDNAVKGLYLGMYSCLFNVKPKHKKLTEVDLKADLAAEFGVDSDHPIMRDDSNAGYVHAPSLNHAVTAAVLRNGYNAKASKENPDYLAINLSSERVRRALGALEGIRNGQSLAAFLGYQFERGLHDRHGLVEVDKFIYPLRRAFPLVADNLVDTKAAETEVIEAIEARNVLDGVKLVEHIQSTEEKKYPFGKDLPAATEAEATAINAEADRLSDTHDAVADLAVAESVHQQVQGNYDRAASTLNAYGQANFPPDPDITKTPRSGISLTHRVALHLETGLDPTLSRAGNASVTPRGMAEPALNKWLAGILPNPAEVTCRVSFTKSDRIPKEITVTQTDLGLEPIDLLYMINPEQDKAMTAIDDWVVRYIVSTESPRPDFDIEIKYNERIDNTIPMFELAALIKNLRSLILRSRALRPGDAILATEALSDDENTAVVDKQRIVLVRDVLESHKNSIGALYTTQAAFDTKVEADKTTIRSTIDTIIDNTTVRIAPVDLLGLPQTGTGAFYDWRSNTYQRCLDLVSKLIDSWQTKLDRCDELLIEYAALAVEVSDEEKFTLLRRAETLVSTEASLLPPAPADLETTVDTKRTAFVTRLNEFKNLLQTTGMTLVQLRNDISALLPVSDFDFEEPDFSAIDKEIIRFFKEMRSQVEKLKNDLETRLTEVDGFLTEYDATSDAVERLEKLETAAKVMLGEDFKIIPEFVLKTEQADEWENTLSDTDQLLDHQITNLGNDFPVDDWMYGVARVREKLRHWESVMFISKAFGGSEPELQPLQFPYYPNDHWLALEVPNDYKVEEERLLYTAHFAAVFDRTKAQAGLLIDEWPEKIPTKEETTGLTFHFDRPNSEPPQSMLLVTPSDFRGSWQWNDVVDAINETLDLSKLRAVEPDFVDDLAYSRFLPATLMAVTSSPITIVANLAENNNLILKMAETE